jgi:hypothetical protein
LFIYLESLVHQYGAKLKGHITINFDGEKGVGTGVTREWFSAISKGKAHTNKHIHTNTYIQINKHIQTSKQTNKQTNKHLHKQHTKTQITEMFNPDNGLFLCGENNTLSPNPKSYVNGDHLVYFEFVGKGKKKSNQNKNKTRT